MATERQNTAQPPVLSQKLCIEDKGEAFESVVEISEADREKLASFLSIESLDCFSFSYQVIPASGDKFLLTGKIHASLTQLCVVTLEPVDEDIEEDFALECRPENQIKSGAEKAAELSPDAIPADPPVPIVDGCIDIGALAAELLASAINPYPRKEGVEFEWDDPKDETAGERTSPFAELAKLKMKR